MSDRRPFRWATTGARMLAGTLVAVLLVAPPQLSKLDGLDVGLHGGSLTPAYARGCASE